MSLYICLSHASASFNFYWQFLETPEFEKGSKKARLWHFDSHIGLDHVYIFGALNWYEKASPISANCEIQASFYLSSYDFV